MTKKTQKRELDVDFIGGEEITQAETKLLSDFFSKKKTISKLTKRRNALKAD
jgi:hypothetical protein